MTPRNCFWLTLKRAKLEIFQIVQWDALMMQENVARMKLVHVQDNVEAFVQNPNV
jgi:hypothetical protein